MMGCLPTIRLSPPVDSDVEVRMWFSRKSRCNRARENFAESRRRRATPDGRRDAATVKDAGCRNPESRDAAPIAEHARS